MKRYLLLLPLLFTGCGLLAETAPKGVKVVTVETKPAPGNSPVEVSAPASHAPDHACPDCTAKWNELAKWRYDEDVRTTALEKREHGNAAAFKVLDQRIKALEGRKSAGILDPPYPENRADNAGPPKQPVQASNYGGDCSDGSCGARGRVIGKGLFFRRR